MVTSYIGRAFALAVLLFLSGSAFAQSTAFNYQGNLKSAGIQANGNFDFEFLLFDSLAGGAQVGTTQAVNGVTVINGTFAAVLDFGNVFTGPPRFLEIRIRASGAGGLTILAPRQQIASTPYTIRALIAADAQSLGGVAANQYVTITNGGASFIRNQTTQQAGANFNISGNGTVGGTLTAASVTGNGAGLTNLNATNISSGSVDPSRLNNAVILNGISQQPSSAFNVSGNGTVGGSLTAGSVNVGTFGLRMNGENLFWMNSANTAGGYLAGRLLTFGGTGDGNTMLGYQAGFRVNSQIDNTFIGANAGFEMQDSRNTFIGSGAGAAMLNGVDNTFVGRIAGQTNAGGNGNTFIGSRAAADTLVNYSTAIGEGAIVSQSNSVVIGAVQTSPTGGPNTRVGIGVSAPSAKLHVVDPSNQGLRVQTNSVGGTVASFGANGAFQIDSTGQPGGRMSLAENGTVTFGGQINQFSSSGNANFFMKGAGAANGINFGVTGTAGSNSTLFISQFNGTTYQDRLIRNQTGNIGIGTSAPASPLHVNGTVRVTNGAVFISNPNTLIITSPNGACWGITVNNSGQLGTFSTACP